MTKLALRLAVLAAAFAGAVVLSLSGLSGWLFWVAIVALLSGRFAAVRA